MKHILVTGGIALLAFASEQARADDTPTRDVGAPRAVDPSQEPVFDSEGVPWFMCSMLRVSDDPRGPSKEEVALVKAEIDRLEKSPCVDLIVRPLATADAVGQAIRVADVTFVLGHGCVTPGCGRLKCATPCPDGRDADQYSANQPIVEMSGWPEKELQSFPPKTALKNECMPRGKTVWLDTCGGPKAAKMMSEQYPGTTWLSLDESLFNSHTGEVSVGRILTALKEQLQAIEGCGAEDEESCTCECRRTIAIVSGAYEHYPITDPEEVEKYRRTYRARP